MKIRNNTNIDLYFYFGDAHREEPTAVFKIAVGDDFETGDFPDEDISIQEK